MTYGGVNSSTVVTAAARALPRPRQKGRKAANANTSITDAPATMSATTPRIRMTETEFDEQMLAFFDKSRVEDDGFRQTFGEELRKTTNWDERSSAQKAKQLQDELVQVRDHQNRLLNLRLLEEIEAETYAAKAQELRDREADLNVQIEAADRDRHEVIGIAIKAFELSQNLRTKSFAADYAAKRRILEIICLNW